MLLRMQSPTSLKEGAVPRMEGTGPWGRCYPQGKPQHPHSCCPERLEHAGCQPSGSSCAGGSECLPPAPRLPSRDGIWNGARNRGVWAQADGQSSLGPLLLRLREAYSLRCTPSRSLTRSARTSANRQHLYLSAASLLRPPVVPPRTGTGRVSDSSRRVSHGGTATVACRRPHCPPAGVFQETLLRPGTDISTRSPPPSWV